MENNMFFTLLQAASIIITTAALGLCIHNFMRNHSKALSLVSLMVTLLGVALTIAIALMWHVPPMLFPYKSTTASLLLYLLLVLLEIRVTWRFWKTRPGSSSIREALDVLEVGLCYYEAGGKVVLCNELMHDISGLLTGSRVLNGQDLKDSLEAIWEPADEADTFRFPLAGKRYHVSVRKIRMEYHQLTELACTDVTSLYENRARLSRDNNRLQEINSHLVSYGGIVDQTIREQEVLDAKIKMHDRFGELLLRSRYAIENNASEAKLDEIRSYLAETIRVLNLASPEQENDYEELRRTAESIGISLHLPDMLGLQDEQSRKIVYLAIRECLSNAVRHAGAANIYVTLDRMSDRDHYTLKIRNDGIRPSGPIKLGTGLSSLEDKVAKMGKTMEVGWDPEFLLRITL